LTALALMDELGCPACGRLFHCGVESSILKSADRQPMVVWLWDGRTWCDLYTPRPTSQDRWMAVGLLIFPALIVALLAGAFPSPGHFGGFWALLTFAAHLGCVLLAVLSYYRVSPFAWGRALLTLGRSSLGWTAPVRRAGRT
jgi:hypothetical protein